MMKKQTTKNNVAIYCRLSVDDGDSNISQSISNQQNILTKYCLDNNLNIYNIYVDDGYSGTNFDRPGFLKLKEDIESGFINIVITKDLSRLGRDYLKVGDLLENYFPDHNIRYIALSDNVDSNNGLDDLLPVKNMINEFYAKDISKKIRATHKYLIETGAVRRSGLPTYGYMYDEKDNRILDPETAPIVVKIFNLFIEGYSVSGIAKILEEEKIITPLNYDRLKRGKELLINPYVWSSSTISSILHNKSYLGDYIKGKTYKRFKSKKVIRLPEEEQHIFKKVFDPIISEETFNLAQTMFVGNKQNSGLTNPYSGIAYCGICGKPLRIYRHTSSKGIYEERLACSNSNEIGKGTILLSDLDLIIKNELLNLKEIILSNIDEFTNEAINRINTLNIDIPSSPNEIKKQKLLKRINEINKYIKNLFEESLNNNITTDTYQRILNEYNTEKNELEIEIKKYELIDENTKNKTSDEWNKIISNFINTLDDLNESNYKSNLIIRNIISKIMITSFKNKDNKSKYDKNIIIYYRYLDSIIKSFNKE